MINKATSVTLWPKVKNIQKKSFFQGRLVAIDYEVNGIPRITKDGVTVAKNLMFVNINK